jgi:hypothetical protein
MAWRVGHLVWQQWHVPDERPAARIIRRRGVRPKLEIQTRSGPVRGTREVAAVAAHSGANVLTQIILVAGIIVSVAEAVAAQTLRDAARDQAVTNPGVPIEQPAAPLGFGLRPRPVEEIAAEADVIVQARLPEIGSHLSAQAEYVQTDYAITEPTVIGGQLFAPNTQTPGHTLPPILEMTGGEVVVSGVTIRTSDHNRGPITEGGRYLLFLKQSRPSEPGRYIVYYAGMLDITQANVRPLFNRGHELYREALGRGLSDFEARIRRARQGR